MLVSLLFLMRLPWFLGDAADPNPEELAERLAVGCLGDEAVRRLKLGLERFDSPQRTSSSPGQAGRSRSPNPAEIAVVKPTQTIDVSIRKPATYRVSSRSSCR